MKKQQNNPGGTSNTKTFGDVCAKCGSRVRYQKTNQCVLCSQRSKIKSGEPSFVMANEKKKDDKALKLLYSFDEWGDIR